MQLPWILLVALILFVASSSFPFASGMLAGGFGGVRDADVEDQQVLTSVVEELRSAHGLAHDDFRAVKVATQVVAGVNYLMKVVCGEGKVVHVKIAKPLPHTQRPPFVLAVNTDPALTEETPLAPFE